MFVDSRAASSNGTIRTQVCVIGAGPAGITVTEGLRDSGLDICLLDSGGLDDPGPVKGLASGENTDPYYYRLADTRDRGFGGSSSRWEPRGVRIRPLDPLDFRSRPEVGRSGWPFSFRDLTPHYDRAHALLGMDRTTYDVDGWTTPSSRNSQDLPSARFPSDLVLPVLFRFAPLGQFRRFEQTLRDARDVRVILGSTALEVDVDDPARPVIQVASGDFRFRVQCDRVVIATGGIEAARLLLLSRRRRPDGLGNGEDLVGRYFMEHPHLRTGAIRLPNDTMSNPLPSYDIEEWPKGRGRLKLALPEERLREEGLLGSAWWVRWRPAFSSVSDARAMMELRETLARRRLLVGTASRLGRLSRHPVAALKILAGMRLGLRGRGSGVLDLAVMAEQLPNPSSRVTLGRRRDGYGQPVANVDWRLSGLDLDSIGRTQICLGDAFAKAGIGVLVDAMAEQDQMPLLGGGYHHMGTTRMSVSPRKGVTDAACRLHECASVYVASSSVFPTAGYANPTLTLIAIADRVAGAIRRDLMHVPDITG